MNLRDMFFEDGEDGSIKRKGMLQGGFEKIPQKKKIQGRNFPKAEIPVRNRKIDDRLEKEMRLQ